MKNITIKIPGTNEGSQLFGIRTKGTEGKEIQVTVYKIGQKTVHATTLGGKPQLISEWIVARSNTVSLDDPRMPAEQKELFTQMKQTSENNGWDTVYYIIK